MKPAGFDSTMLSLLLNPNCKPPTDADGNPIPLAKRRAEFLVEKLGKSKQKIIIPTPVAAEVLTAIGPDAQAYFEIVAQQRLFDIASFDPKCAIELALLNRNVFGPNDRKDRLEPYQKVKIDRQILAIFVACGVYEVYTDDLALGARARLCGLMPIRTAELPVPESDRQIRMEFEQHAELSDSIADVDAKSAIDTSHTSSRESGSS